MSRRKFRFAPKQNLTDVSRDWLDAMGFNINPGYDYRESLAFEQLYQELKGSGIWQRLERIYPIGNVGPSATICARSGDVMTAVNSPNLQFNVTSGEPYGGIAFNGSSSYLRMTKPALQITSGDGHFYVFCSTIPASTAYVSLYGIVDTTTSTLRLQTRRNGTNRNLISNMHTQTSTDAISATVVNQALGYRGFLTVRDTSGISFYTDGSLTQNVSSTSTGTLPPYNIGIGCSLNRSGTPSNYAAYTVGFITCGASLDATQASILHNAVVRYRSKLAIPLEEG